MSFFMKDLTNHYSPYSAILFNFLINISSFQISLHFIRIFISLYFILIVFLSGFKVHFYKMKMMLALTIII
jgi:hypothetical protein